MEVGLTVQLVLGDDMEELGLVDLQSDRYTGEPDESQGVDE